MLKTCQKHLCILSLLLLLFPLVSTLHGQVQEIVISDDGKIKSTFYNDGILARQKWYGDKKKLDSLKAYYNSGELNEEFYYKNGHYDGTCYKYDKSGKKMVTWEFKKGSLVTRTDHIIDYDKKNQSKVLDYHKRLKVLNEELIDYPRSLKRIYGRARIRKYFGNNTLALSDFTKLKRTVEKNPECKLSPKTRAAVYDHLAALYDRYEMENHIVHYMLKAIKEAPRQSRLYNNLGASFVKRQSYQLGIGYLNKTIEMVPGHSFAHSNLSIAYSDLGQYEKAMEHVQIAFPKEKSLIKSGSKGKGERDLRTTRGLLYHKLGDTLKGITDLMEALSINKNNSFALKNLGIVFYDIGNYKKACELFNQSLELGYEKIYDRDDLQPYIDSACRQSDANPVEDDFTFRTLNEQPILYPNPVRDVANIKNFDFQDFNYNIYNYESKLLKSGKSNDSSINFSDFHAGFYLLEIEKNGERYILKVVKE